MTCSSGCEQAANWQFLDGSSPGANFPWVANNPNGMIVGTNTGCAVIRGIDVGENDVNDVSCLNSYTQQFACQSAITVCGKKKARKSISKYRFSNFCVSFLEKLPKLTKVPKLYFQSSDFIDFLAFESSQFDHS